MPKHKSADIKFCSLCRNQDKGYAIVFPDATSDTARQLYSSVSSLLDGVFPFKELVLCRSRCQRHVIGLAKQLNEVGRILFSFIFLIKYSFCFISLRDISKIKFLDRKIC